MAILPGELTDRIIDHLHDDADALKICSLTCKTWLPSSRHHLFSTVRIDANLTSFLSIVDVSWSTLGPAIQRLVLHKIERLPFPIMPYDLLPLRLPNVRTLELADGSIDGRPSLENVLLRLDLEQLKIHYITPITCTKLVHIICAYPRLKHLTLSRYLSDSPMPGSILETPSQRLSLTMANLRISPHFQCLLFGQWLLDHCQSLQIDSLNVTFGKDMLPFFRQLLCSCGSSIKTVILCLPDETEPYLPEDAVDLAPCINLRSIEIEIPTTAQSTISLIPAIISTISSFHLEELFFLFSFYAGNFPDCTEIIKSLTRSPSPFINLKKITVCNEGDSRNWDDSLEDTIKKEFSVFDALGILDVQVCEYVGYD